MLLPEEGEKELSSKNFKNLFSKFFEDKMKSSKFLFSSRLSDFKLTLPDGSEIPTHRIILATQSEYFNSLFENHPEITEVEVEEETEIVKKMVEFFYFSGYECYTYMQGLLDYPGFEKDLDEILSGSKKIIYSKLLKLITFADYLDFTKFFDSLFGLDGLLDFISGGDSILILMGEMDLVNRDSFLERFVHYPEALDRFFGDLNVFLDFEEEGEEYSRSGIISRADMLALYQQIFDVYGRFQTSAIDSYIKLNEFFGRKNEASLIIDWIEEEIVQREDIEYEKSRFSSYTESDIEEGLRDSFVYIAMIEKLPNMHISEKTKQEVRFKLNEPTSKSNRTLGENRYRSRDD